MEVKTSIHTRAKIKKSMFRIIYKDIKKNKRLVKRSVESISYDKYLNEIINNEPILEIRPYKPIYKNLTNGDYIMKESCDILDYEPQGVVITLVRTSYLNKHDKVKPLYCGIWVTVTPSILLNTNDMEYWKKNLLKELRLIMGDLSPHIKPISQFNVNYISSEFPITFEKRHESSEYYNLLHNSAFYNKYYCEDTSCNDNTEEIFTSNDTDSFKLAKGNHSLYIKRVGSQINLGIILNYQKLYETFTREVKTLGHILESLEHYTRNSIVSYYSNIYGNSSYVTLSKLYTVIHKCNYPEGKKNRMLALVEETNTHGNLNRVLEKIKDKKEYNKTNAIINTLINELCVNPLALPEKSTLYSSPGPLIRMFDAIKIASSNRSVPQTEVNDND
jgi:hypothetical protein